MTLKDFLSLPAERVLSIIDLYACDCEEIGYSNGANDSEGYLVPMFKPLPFEEYLKSIEN